MLHNNINNFWHRELTDSLQSSHL